MHEWKSGRHGPSSTECFGDAGAGPRGRPGDFSPPEWVTAGAASRVVATLEELAPTRRWTRSGRPGREASGFAAGSGHPGSILASSRACEEEVFGEVDIMINNAATVAPLGQVAQARTGRRDCMPQHQSRAFSDLLSRPR